MRGGLLGGYLGRFLQCPLAQLCGGFWRWQLPGERLGARPCEEQPLPSLSGGDGPQVSRPGLPRNSALTQEAPGRSLSRGNNSAAAEGGSVGHENETSDTADHGRPRCGAHITGSSARSVAGHPEGRSSLRRPRPERTAEQPEREAGAWQTPSGRLETGRLRVRSPQDPGPSSDSGHEGRASVAAAQTCCPPPLPVAPHRGGRRSGNKPPAPVRDPQESGFGESGSCVGKQSCIPDVSLHGGAGGRRETPQPVRRVGETPELGRTPQWPAGVLGQPARGGWARPGPGLRGPSMLAVRPRGVQTLPAFGSALPSPAGLTGTVWAGGAATPPVALLCPLRDGALREASCGTGHLLRCRGLARRVSLAGGRPTLGRPSTPQAASPGTPRGSEGPALAFGNGDLPLGAVVATALCGSAAAQAWTREGRPWRSGQAPRAGRRGGDVVCRTWTLRGFLAGNFSPEVGASAAGPLLQSRRVRERSAAPPRTPSGPSLGPLRAWLPPRPPPPQRDCQNYIKILLPLNSSHLFACGTAAFSPLCTYISLANFTLARDGAGKVLLEDGKGRCPFDPNFKSTALVVEGELYTGTVSSFQGNDPAISRSQTTRPTKTESSLNWLQDPAFVASAYIPESLGSQEGDDDKIYFFFSETGQEFEFFENTIVSRVARVCKGDEGGERVLQQRWTSFLKAQLLCSRPEDGFPFNVLQDVFTLSPSPQHWPQTLFYGVFTSQWHRGSSEGSAVCVFTMDDVRRAFEGLYKEVNRETQQWYTAPGPVPSPRPGACINNQAREKRISSSLQLPDRVLNFLKDHFLMDRQVRSQMLLLQPRARYQRVAVQRVRGLDRTYDVLFLGTGDGWLHKAVVVGSRVHVIEELQLFPEGQPVHSLLLDAQGGLLYAASHSGVVQVPVANCSLYRSCGDCLLARDPYCAWTNSGCTPTRLRQPEPASRLWVQDIDGANTGDLCNVTRPLSRKAEGNKSCKQVHFEPHTVNTLPCPLLSSLASRLWLHNGVPVNASATCHVLPSGDLLLVGSQREPGEFQCWSLEEGFRQLVASYCPVVEDVAADHADQGRSVPDINTSQVSAPAAGHASWGGGRSYWTEFLVMCTLFVLAVMLLVLFLLHRHRGNMKVFLKQGECASVHPKPRPIVLPPETRPLNGVGPPSIPLDHRGYQALSDSSPGPRPVTESEKRPLSLQDSFVEVSPLCPRPRVRLGSEIRDSVV
ncbi:PREDICTED: semaphorin-4B [Condylura cristata]|uniref:semaphorin-4B n=1 Tax=Condylura cristata TaxID=143302 RepID=UPI000642C9DD|nr:PREDICTED: semaphorin-4B [Condylura cristata]